MRSWLGGSGGGSSASKHGIPVVPHGAGATCSPPDDSPCGEGGNGPGACMSGKVGNVPQAGPQTGYCPGSAPVRVFPPCPENAIDNQMIGSVPVDLM